MAKLGVLMLSALGFAGVQSPPLETRRSDVDDIGVLKAVLEQTILPEVRKRTSGTPLALVWNQTVSICRDGIPQDGRCIDTTDGWMERLWPGLVEGATTRKQLVSSFISRNATTHVLPSFQQPGVVFGPPDATGSTIRRYANRIVAFSSLTLPGYSTNGLAIVYATYECGHLCGHGQFVLLQHSGNGWQVRSSDLLWVS
jgi:hypothetical protein